MKPGQPEATIPLASYPASISHSPALDSQPPPHIPDHTLVRCIGRGSYGEVWLARSVVGTWRAVKVVRRATFEREFRGIQKFEPISRAHEGFVDILQIGRNDEAGYFYYVMELADDANDECRRANVELSAQRADANSGPSFVIRNSEFYIPKTLRSAVRPDSQLATLNPQPTRLPVSDCVDIGVTLASALAHLHKHGLVHRDIKPSNIIFVGGVPKLADIGLVADASEARSFVGTVGFIPPEGPGSPQADLYSLGKVLYEISTGQDRQDFPQLPPDLLRESANAECGARSAESPSEASQSIPHSALRTPHSSPLIELNEVLLKACHKDVRQRYPSADAMRADLELLQRGQSVQRKHAVQARIRIAKKFCLIAGVIALATVLGQFVLRQVEKKQRAGLQNPQRGSSAGTTNQTAFNAYQMGRFFQNKMNRAALNKAIEHFDQAIQLDPKFAQAYAGMLDCFLWAPDFSGRDLMPKIKASADKLLELNDTLAEGHTALAVFNMGSWDWSAAEREFKRAIELHDEYAPAHLWYGFHLVCLTRLEEAEREFKRAEQLAPTIVGTKVYLGFPAFGVGQYDAAVAQFQKALDMEPDAAIAHVWMAYAYEAKGDFQQAIDHFEKYALFSGRGSATATSFEALRRGLRESGEKGYWLAWLEQRKADNDFHLIARCYAHLDEKQRALEWLERAATEQPDVAIWFKFDAHYHYASLRSDPRFVALLEKAGLGE